MPTNVNMKLARWSAFCLTIAATPVVSCLPLVFNFIDSNNGILRAYYLQGIGLASLFATLIIVCAGLFLGSACRGTCQYLAHSGQIATCNESCVNNYTYAFIFASILLLTGAFCLFRSSLQLSMLQRPAEEHVSQNPTAPTVDKSGAYASTSMTSSTSTFTMTPKPIQLELTEKMKQSGF
ncbi:UNVERIFIED_CONTAM: hypothetical protein HDU68_011777 [Siphonaria sp. JEL0065]|nr:hypothetical protein HDU68_011777 [Siphonaria sp. JEL0065]